MSDKQVPPSVGEFAIGERDQLLARVAKLEAERDRLKRSAQANWNEFAEALKQPSAGVDERELFEADELRRHPGAPLFRMPESHKRAGQYQNQYVESAWRAWQARAQLAAPAGVPDGWRIDREGDRIVVQGPYGGYAAERQGLSGIAESILYCLADAMLAAAPSPAPKSGDGMCNADNPANRCVCREEFGYRACTPSIDVVPVPRPLLEDLRDLASDAAEHHRAAYASHKPARQASIDSTVEAARARLKSDKRLREEQAYVSELAEANTRMERELAAAKPDAELLELLRLARADGFHDRLSSALIKRIDAKLAEVQS